MTSTILISEPYVYNSTEELEKNFEKIGFLGAGGEGCVYSVKDKITDTMKALKLSQQNCRIFENNKIVAKKITEVVDQGLSPHLTKLYAIIGYTCLAETRLSGSTSPGFFGEAYEGMPKKSYTRLGWLMEKMDGDVEKIVFNLSDEEQLSYSIQMASINHVLHQKNVRNMESHKARNVLYKKLTPEDTFNGKKLQDFDFWKYVFGKYEFYLPRAKYLFKQADYDPWVYVEETKKIAPEERLKIVFQDEKFTLDDVAAKFQKPTDLKAKIIEIYSS